MVRDEVCFSAANAMANYMRVLATTAGMSENELITTVALFSAACATPSIRDRFEVAQKEAFERIDGASLQ